MSAAVAAVTAFNLICTGTQMTGELLKMGDPKEVSTIIRVDLERGRWCSGTCETTTPLYGTSETFIVFRKEGDVFDVEKGDISDRATFVNRESGEYIDRSRFWVGGKMLYTLTQGRCKKSEFTGFPERKF